MTNLKSDPFNPGPKQRQTGKHLSVNIPGNYLRGALAGLQPYLVESRLLYLRINVGVISHSPADLACGNRFKCFFQPIPVSLSLTQIREPFQTENSRFGMNAMSSAQCDCFPVTLCYLFQDLDILLKLVENQVHRLLHTQGEGSINYIGGGQPHMK